MREAVLFLLAARFFALATFFLAEAFFLAAAAFFLTLRFATFFFTLRFATFFFTLRLAAFFLTLRFAAAAFFFTFRFATFFFTLRFATFFLTLRLAAATFFLATLRATTFFFVATFFLVARFFAEAFFFETAFFLVAISVSVSGCPRPSIYKSIQISSNYFSHKVFLRCRSHSGVSANVRDKRSDRSGSITGIFEEAMRKHYAYRDLINQAKYEIPLLVSDRHDRQAIAAAQKSESFEFGFGMFTHCL